MAESNLDLVVADGRGVVADLGASLLVATVLAGLGRWPTAGRLVAAVIAGLWSLVHFANYEHIKALGSVVNPANAGYVADWTFLFGSVLGATHPVLIVVITALSMVATFFAVNTVRRREALRLLLVMVPLMFVTVLVPTTDRVAGWRQTDPVSIQLSRLIRRSPPTENLGRLAWSRLVEQDLQGIPRVAHGPAVRNVLLVILEGASGAFLPSLRDRHGARSSITMPGLDRIARQGLAYASFVSTQRQTNRGEYALLCGDYPKLTSAEAKMSELAGTGPIECLPRVLSRSGFSTVYLQAAPLPFMLKDQFMAQSGFDRVLGNAWFESARYRNHWGIDDQTLFEGGLGVIRELDSRDQPWFLTLLTVGTHHRYSVPPDFQGRYAPGTQEWAFEYLDQAVTSFVSELESAGILDDTLVLITSDESQATVTGGPDLDNMRSQAWGFLIALTPARERGIVDEIFTQADLPQSVVDVAQEEPFRYRFSGRSVFRVYRTPRPVFWGNTHLRMVAGLAPPGDLTICGEDLRKCSTSQVEGYRVFAPQLETRESTQDEIEWLRGAVAGSQVSQIPESRRQVPLIGLGNHPVLTDFGEQYLFGGQFLSVPPHARIDVEILAALHGNSGWLEFAHNFVVERRPVLAWTGKIRVGETLRLEYTVGTECPLADIESRMWITSSEGEDLVLRFSSASLSTEVLARSQSVPETGLKILEINRSPVGEFSQVESSIE